jgi:sphingomyelin phosphodiesterase acid-like 3
MLLLLISVAAARDFFVVSDPHLDIFYNDTAPVQNHCHSDSTSEPAKSLGRSGCDSSEKLLRSTLKHMREVQADPEFIVVTGDIVGHYTYDMLTEDGRIDKAYNRRMVQRTYSTITNLFKEFFPDTQVILAYGNNDGYGDYWNPTSAESHEFWESLELYYEDLNPDISESFTEGGYYLTHSSSGLPVIVLNTNFFTIKTSSVSSARRDAQFDWLEEQLQVTSEPAIIVMHIPPGVDKYHGKMSWHAEDTATLLRILDRNQGAVSLILAGHLHSQTFELLNDTPVMIHSAISPLYWTNPMFRRYQTTESSYNYTDYALDLYADKPTWEVEYSFNTAGFRSLFDLLSSSPLARLDYIRKAMGVSRSNLSEAVMLKMYLGDGADPQTSMWAWECSMEFIDPEAYDSCIA